LVKYTYDSQNQLTKEEHYNGNGTATSNITKTYEYAYDTAGNILTEKVDGVLTKNYTYSTGQWTDKLLAFNGTVFSYDLNGNPLTYANGVYNYSMQWEHGRQLCYTGVDNGRGISDIFYQYDADGIRTLKNDGGNEHYYLTQNGRVIRERIGTGSTAKVLDFIYDESGKPCALIYTNGTATPLVYYYVLNLQGDVVKLVNATGESRAEYTYNAWGEVLSATGIMAAINPLRYRGYYYDTETGFYYLQSRYYDPVTHRFINADSFASTGAGFIGTNMFAYCNNNPIAYRDDSGHAIFPTTFVTSDGGGIYKNENVIVISNSNSGWMRTSQIMGDNLANAIGNGYVRVVDISSSNFTETWNNIKEGYVIIHTHGTPNSLVGDDFKVTTEEVNNLNKNKNIDNILITACSTGGVNGTGQNIAKTFSRKISSNGFVVCSSTTVLGNDNYFTALDNGAWILYRNGMFVNKRLPSTISIAYIATTIFSK